jgi:hypothetical protein
MVIVLHGDRGYSAGPSSMARYILLLLLLLHAWMVTGQLGVSLAQACPDLDHARRTSANVQFASVLRPPPSFLLLLGRRTVRQIRFDVGHERATLEETSQKAK